MAIISRASGCCRPLIILFALLYDHPRDLENSATFLNFEYTAPRKLFMRIISLCLHCGRLNYIINWMECQPQNGQNIQKLEKYIDFVDRLSYNGTRHRSDQQWKQSATCRSV